MKSSAVPHAERILILAPRGRDALVAKVILRDAKVRSEICVDLGEVIHEIERGADIAVITEEATRGPKVEQLGLWVASHQVLFQKSNITENDRQQIIEIVGHPWRELPNRLEPLHLAQRGFNPLTFLYLTP